MTVSNASRKVYEVNAARLLLGQKSAILIPRTSADRFESDGHWAEAGHLVHHTAVDAVEHMGRYQTHKGTRLAVHDDDDWRYVCDVVVEQIYAVDNPTLSPDMIDALGFESPDDYHAHDTLSRGKGWLLFVKSISQDTESNHP